jgi:hypothetical protein
MATQFQPLPNTNLAIPRAAVLIADVGSDTFTDLGDAENVALNIEVEEVERYSKNSGLKNLRASNVLQVTAALTLELADMTKFARAITVGGKEEKYAQIGEVGLSKMVQNVDSGSIIKLPGFGVENVTVDDGSGAVQYIEGVHYTLLPESGYVQITAIPVGADSDVNIGFDLEDKTNPGDEIFQAGIGSFFNVRKTVHIVSVNRVGPRDLLVLNDVQMRVDGERAFVGGDEFATVSIAGKCFVDPSKSQNYQIGYLSEISNQGAA